MVGFAAKSADESLSNRVAKLSDLKISTAQRESEAQLHAAEAEIKSQTANADLTPQDNQYIGKISRHLARELRGESRWPHADTKLRYEVAKEQVRTHTVLAGPTCPASAGNGESVRPLR